MGVTARPSDNFAINVLDPSGGVLFQVTTNTSAAQAVLLVYGNAAKNLGGNTWTVFSDERLKQNIRPYDHGLDAILKLKTARFEYLDDPKRHTTSGHEEIGLIAQQVEGIIPEAVTQDAEGYRTLNASPIYWAAINAIQELNGKVENRSQDSGARIQALTEKLNRKDAEIAELKQRLSALEKLLNRLSVVKNGGGQ